MEKTIIASERELNVIKSLGEYDPEIAYISAKTFISDYELNGETIQELFRQIPKLKNDPEVLWALCFQYHINMDIINSIPELYTVKFAGNPVIYQMLTNMSISEKDIMNIITENKLEGRKVAERVLIHRDAISYDLIDFLYGYDYINTCITLPRRELLPLSLLLIYKNDINIEVLKNNKDLECGVLEAFMKHIEESKNVYIESALMLNDKVSDKKKENDKSITIDTSDSYKLPETLVASRTGVGKTSSEYKAIRCSSGTKLHVVIQKHDELLKKYSEVKEYISHRVVAMPLFFCKMQELCAIKFGINKEDFYRDMYSLFEEDKINTKKHMKDKSITLAKINIGDLSGTLKYYLQPYVDNTLDMESLLAYGYCSGSLDVRIVKDIEEYKISKIEINKEEK